jgi:NAD(P)H dehydrogenase (quinone)
VKNQPQNMKNNILIINAHPDKDSFCGALADSYTTGATATGASCKRINLKDLQFNPILTHGYKQESVLEPDLVDAQQKIVDADHLVFVYPNWWGTYPALLKGFLDRAFLPGFAFKYRKNSPWWDKLLKGKSARVLVTMDSPNWYYYFVNKSPGHNSMKTAILGFCGVSPVNITSFGPVKASTEQERSQWLATAEKLGNRHE